MPDYIPIGITFGETLRRVARGLRDALQTTDEAVLRECVGMWADTLENSADEFLKSAST